MWTIEQLYMGIFNFFKLPKHQSFDYVPRYYNPDKEDLQRRLKQAENSREDNVQAAKQNISAGLRGRGSFKKGYVSQRKKQVFKSNMVLLGSIIILILISYKLLTVYLPHILQYLE